ncbi:biopolymer transporter ExbD [Candidatus Aerophobetes bacterium]|nr:biopolymer transporter ExbD [Candidatus Aerophobetes bacterium]
MKEFLRKKIPLSLEITPLVDVVLLLLIFFFMTFSVSMQSMQLDLPEASSEEHVEEALTILINQDGEIFLGEDSMNLETLLPFLRQLSTEYATRTISIQADANVPLKVAVQVMDICQRAGFMGISIATRKGESN